MNHDPMCPWGAEGDSDECYRIEGLEHPMTVCDLIARVREHEKWKADLAITIWEQHANGAYSRALRDAIEAVKAELAALRPIIKKSRPLLTDMDVVGQAEHRAIAAIEALGGEQ